MGVQLQSARSLNLGSGTLVGSLDDWMVEGFKIQDSSSEGGIKGVVEGFRFWVVSFFLQFCKYLRVLYL